MKLAILGDNNALAQTLTSTALKYGYDTTLLAPTSKIKHKRHKTLIGDIGSHAPMHELLDGTDAVVGLFFENRSKLSMQQFISTLLFHMQEHGIKRLVLGVHNVAVIHEALESVTTIDWTTFTKNSIEYTDKIEATYNALAYDLINEITSSDRLFKHVDLDNRYASV